MHVYLDSMGTLIRPGKPPPEGLHEFLQYLHREHEISFLSSLAHTGDNAQIRHFLENRLPKKTFDLLKDLPATPWTNSKVEAIDPDSPFRWLDDSPSATDIARLAERSQLESLVLIDLETRPYLQSPEKLLKLN